jgi:hypothetical protein
MTGSAMTAMPARAWAYAIYTGLLWFGLTQADPKSAPAPTPEAELLEFLASFETQTGQWPELNDALAKPIEPAPPARPKGK